MFAMPKSVVFIDANVSDVEHLLSGVLPTVDVQVLADDASGIDQITDYLKHHPASTVHIVSHGAPGRLLLGNSELNLENLNFHAEVLSTWFASANATLLLYGCNVAAGDAGAEFIEKLHTLTGAEIAASRQVIGRGYWSLEVSPTHITAHAPFSTAVLETWAGELAHFRGGQISWVPNDTDGDGINDDALITLKAAWAPGSAFPPSMLSGLTGIGQTLVSNTVVDITTANAGTYSFSTTVIQANNFNVNTAYIGNYTSTARISNLINNANGRWDIQSTFLLAGGNRAPQIDLPIILDVPTLDASGNALASWTYNLAVVDPDGDNVRYRLANLTELGGGSSTNPTGFSIDATTGLVTWTGSGSLTRGLYSAGLVVEDLDSNGNVKSKSHVDFILNLTNLRAALVDVTGAINSSQTTVNLGATEVINFSFGGGVTVQALSTSGGALTGTSPSFTYNAGAVSTGVYPVTFRISQAGAADSYKTYNFVVADVNAPAITGIGGDIVTWGREPVAIDSSGDATVSYPGGSDLSGGFLRINAAFVDVGEVGREPVAIDSSGDATVSYPGGSDLSGGFLRINAAFVDVGEVVQVNNEGTGAGQIGVSGSNVLYEGQIIGTIDAAQNGNGNALLINFTTAAATPAAITALIRNITYNNGTTGEPTDGNRSVSIVLSNGSISNNYTSNIDVAHVHNFPPTGTVTISGTAEQGSTLTASNNLSDPDGLGAITYTWFANGSDTGVTGPTYTLTQNDVGKVFTVQASYTDVFGTPESVTSAPTAAIANVNDGPTGGVTLSGTATQGQTLTANTTTLADADGLGTLNYQWEQSTDGTNWTTISGATASTFTLTQDQVNQRVRVKVSYTDNGNTSEEVISNATTSPVANVNDGPTGGVTLNGTATQGQTLTANTTTLADADGLGSLNYQWEQSTDGTNWTTISGATASTFTLTQDQVNQRVRVKVSYTDNGNTSEEVISNATTNPVANVNDGPTGGVTLSGTLKEGEILTANTTTLADADGLGSFNYQWEQSTDGTNWTTISGASSSTFTLTQDQVGQRVRVKVSYTDGGNTTEEVTSPASNTPIVPLNNAPTGAVTLTGAARECQVLTANTSTLADADGLGSFSYQWQLSADGSTNWSTITGANASTYALDESHVGSFVRAVVSYTDGAGNQETVLGASSGEITPVYPHDFNGDGMADVAWHHNATGQNSLWYMNQTQFNGGTALTSTNGWRMRALGNFNGDCSPDILWRHNSDGGTVIWQMNGTSIDRGIRLDTVGTLWDIVGTGDFNGDDKTDILWRHANTGVNTVWLMDGTTRSGNFNLPTRRDANWRLGAVGDFTDDGVLDVVWQNTATGANEAWVFADSTYTTYTTEAIRSVGAGWNLVGAADFNQDGNKDLFWQHQSTGATSVWSMDGFNFMGGNAVRSVQAGWAAVL